MASEIRTIMPGWRFRISGTAMRRKGTPPIRKTSVAKIGAIHRLPGNTGTVKPNHIWSMSLYSNTGTDKARLIQKRLRNISSWPVWSGRWRCRNRSGQSWAQTLLCLRHRCGCRGRQFGKHVHSRSRCVPLLRDCVPCVIALKKYASSDLRRRRRANARMRLQNLAARILMAQLP